MALTLPHRSRKGESTCCAVSFDIMSGLYEGAHLDGSQRDGYLTDDEFRDMSEMFDLDGASQAPDDSRSRVMSGDYELPVLPGLTDRERPERPSVATTTATAISSDDDDGLFTEGESEAERDEEDSDLGDAGDETTSKDRIPQWKVDHYMVIISFKVS
jgi:hypothetical protein